MDFGLSEEHRRLQERCRQLAADFATRSGEHDRDASHPTENYDRLRQEGFLELSVPRELGGTGVGFLGHTIAYEALGQGCPSTALSFNMHASVVMPLLDSPMVAQEAKQHIADLVVRRKRLLAGNYSEATSTALMGERWLDTVVRRTDDGWRITGRKMFASMLQAADYCLVLARPDTATRPTAGAFVLIPRNAPGRSVIANWDVMGMRATRSDSLVLDDCQVEASAVVYQSDDIRTFRAQTSSWAWGSYTAVYLGVAGAIYAELLRVVGSRQVPGYSQPLAYHPDVRRQVAQLSADLEAARLVMYKSAWLYDTQGGDAGDDGRPFPRQICGGRGRRAYRAHRADAVGVARHLQGRAHRAALPRRRAGAPARAAIGLLPVEHGHPRAGPRPGRGHAAAEAGRSRGACPAAGAVNSAQVCVNFPN